MVVLRNREILPTEPTPKYLTKQSTPEPVTPNPIHEPSASRSSQSPPSLSPNLENHELGSDCKSTLRRSLRLASKSVAADGYVENGSRKRKGATSIRSMEENKVVEDQIVNEGKAKGDDVDCKIKEVLSLRSGKRVVKRRVEYNSGDKPVTEKGREGKDEDLNAEEVTREKGKGKLGEEMEYDVGQGVVNIINKLENNQDTYESCNSMVRKRYSEEQKGKGKLVDDGSVSNVKEALELKSMVKDLVDSLGDTVAMENGRQSKKANKRVTVSRMEQFRDIARQNASRFAHFENQEQEEEHLPSQVDVEMPSVQGNQEIEDWPGPFSTAMKIIRDRESKANSRQGPSTLEKAKSVPITWIPRSSKGSKCSKASIPSLQELCMRIIVNNCDAVSSLEHVPDALRHRLCQLLCDSKRMNSHFLDLLVHGSPTEIRVKDCSWLTEENFLKSFEGCDTNNLTVLQLDQCGRCMPDYILPATLARSSRSLPALISLSLAGACRLSDIGLSSIVSSAPALRSINLSQCSLLTSTGIVTLADSLGSVLQELYIDDCQSLDPMLLLPTLKKLEHLQVLSLAGNQTICDDFVREFLAARGHNMKELVLSDCVKLTDSSIKVIAETCPGLCALNLVNLRKLTDFSLGYLANGCQEIQTLKLCRNAFSDEAIAAFVETSGEVLKDLSLNNVKKVGNNTALSLARRSRNLLSLDLSWCRNLTDEAVGLIVDSCSSLRVLKLFGCGQVTEVLLDGHSNQHVQIIGLKMSPVLEHIKVPDSQEFPLRYSWVPSM
ncbi:hypothetical protein JCGZ_07482 [Jatropha curcas]|uniref:Uncharacterized protein n=1 Tax=Jatropha curcas TaxID=180498 RepID=A0A067KCG3_JATCU|nr:F-box/LRR-repeat protein 4 [Jatropha curcas]KDP33911.1 hypothetical protein JCGZ_07482 [Jatropha curcas]